VGWGGYGERNLGVKEKRGKILARGAGRHRTTGLHKPLRRSPIAGNMEKVSSRGCVNGSGGS